MKAKPIRIHATESVNYEMKRMQSLEIGSLIPPECKTEDVRPKHTKTPPLAIPEEYHAKIVDHVNVLGIDFYNRECSTATG